MNNINMNNIIFQSGWAFWGRLTDDEGKKPPSLKSATYILQI